jgi:hypothetical protein
MLATPENKFPHCGCDVAPHQALQKTHRALKSQELCRFSCTAAALACFLLLPSRTIDRGANTAAAEETKERGYGRGHGNFLQRDSPAGHHTSQLS